MKPHHMETPLINPEECAKIATKASKTGDTFHAFRAASASIRARAGWVLVNGRWVGRKNVMRTT